MKHQSASQILNNSSGQGITEYILLLLILVMVFLGGIYQLNTAFEKWANNYFGNYLACLLETGELPSIGGAPGDSGICNEMFESFSLANGRQLKPNFNGGEPGDGSGGSSDDGSAGRGDPDKGAGGVREGQSSRGSYVSSGSSFGSSRSMNNGRPQKVRVNRQKEKAKYTGSTASSLPAGAGYSQVNSREGRPQYVAVYGKRVVDVKEEERGQTKQTSSVKRTPGSNDSNRRVKVLRKEINKDVMIEDEPMTIGGYIRFLIIAAIIIALVLLLGGQALQISKNSE